MLAVETAKANGSIISFDPNIRMFLWQDEDMLRKMLNYGLSNCTVLKMSKDEAIYQSGICDPVAAMESILKNYPNISVAFLTLGEKGSMVFSGESKAYLWVSVFIPSVCLFCIQAAGGNNYFRLYY